MDLDAVIQENKQETVPVEIKKPKSLSKHKEEDDEEEEEEEEDKIVEKSPNGRFHKRNKRFPRQMQGVDNAFVAIEPKSGKEVIWNESILPEKKTERENRFLVVIKKLKKNSHPFLVRFLDAWITKTENGPRILVFITERLDEGTLKQYLCNSTRNYKLWKRHIGQLLSVLMYLHSLGVTHGNLTKENIYYQNYGSLKVGPFALAGFLDQKAQSADVYMLGMIALEIAVWDPSDDSPNFSITDRIQRMLDKIEFSNQRNFIEACLDSNPSKRPKIRTLINHSAVAEVPTLKLLSANVIVNTLKHPSISGDDPIGNSAGPFASSDSGSFNSLLKEHMRHLEDDTVICEVHFPKDEIVNSRCWKDFRSNFTLTSKYLDDVKSGFYPLFICRPTPLDIFQPEVEDQMQSSGVSISDENVSGNVFVPNVSGIGTNSIPQTASNTSTANSLNSSRKHSNCVRNEYASTPGGILAGTGFLQCCTEAVELRSSSESCQSQDTLSRLEGQDSKNSDLNDYSLSKLKNEASRIVENSIFKFEPPDFDTEEALDFHAKNMGEVPFVDGFSQTDSGSGRALTANLSSYATPSEEFPNKDIDWNESKLCRENIFQEKEDEGGIISDSRIKSDFQSRTSRESSANIDQSPSNGYLARRPSLSNRKGSTERETDSEELPNQEIKNLNVDYQQNLSSHDHNDLEYEELDEEGANSDDVTDASSSGDEGYFPEGIIGGHHVSFSIAGAATSWSQNWINSNQGDGLVSTKMQQPPKLVYITAPDKCPTESALFTHCQYIYIGCGRWQVYIQMWFVEERLKREVLDSEWHDSERVADLFQMSKCLNPSDRPALVRLLSLARHNFPLIDGELKCPLPPNCKSGNFDAFDLYERLVALHLHQQAKEILEIWSSSADSCGGSMSPSPSDRHLLNYPSIDTNIYSEIKEIDTKKSTLFTDRTKTKKRLDECLCGDTGNESPPITRMESIFDAQNQLQPRKNISTFDARPSIDSNSASKYSFPLQAEQTAELSEDSNVSRISESQQIPRGILMDIGCLAPRNAGCANCDKHDYLHRSDLPSFLTSPCYHCRESLAKDAKISPEALLDLYLQNGIPWPAFFQVKYNLPAEQTDTLSLEELIAYDCKWRSRSPCVCYVSSGKTIMPPCVEFPGLYNVPLNCCDIPPQDEHVTSSTSLNHWESRSASTEQHDSEYSQSDTQQQLIDAINENFTEAQLEEPAQSSIPKIPYVGDEKIPSESTQNAVVKNKATFINQLSTPSKDSGLLPCTSRHTRGCQITCLHGFTFPKLQTRGNSILPLNVEDIQTQELINPPAEISPSIDV